MTSKPITLTPGEALQIAGELLNLIDAASDDLKSGVDMIALQQQFAAAAAAQKRQQELNYAG